MRIRECMHETVVAHARKKKYNKKTCTVNRTEKKAKTSRLQLVRGATVHPLDSALN